MEDKQVVRYVKLVGGSQISKPALVTSYLRDSLYAAAEGKHPALNLIVIDNSAHAGSSEFQHGLQRIMGVKHFDHPDVQAKKELQFYVELNATEPAEVPAIAERVYNKLRDTMTAHGEHHMMEFANLSERERQYWELIAATACNVAWEIPAGEIPEQTGELFGTGEKPTELTSGTEPEPKPAAPEKAEGAAQ